MQEAKTFYKKLSVDAPTITFWIFEISFSYILLLIGVFISIWLAVRTIHEKKLSLKFLNDHIFLYTIAALFMGRIGVFYSLY